MRRACYSAVLVVLIVGSAASVRANEELYAVIDKAIKAHGGEEKLTTLRAGRSKNKGTIDLLGGIPFTQSVSYQLPNQFREVFEGEVNNQKLTIITVYNRNKGWISINGQTQEMDEKLLAEMKEVANLLRASRLTILKDKLYTLAPLGEAKVEGRAAIGIKVSAKGYRDINFFFDKETGLIVKTERRALDVMTGQEYTEERFALDYKDRDGLKVPTRARVQKDGKKLMDAEILEYKALDKLDESEFAKP